MLWGTSNSVPKKERARRIHPYSDGNSGTEGGHHKVRSAPPAAPGSHESQVLRRHASRSLQSNEVSKAAGSHHPALLPDFHVIRSLRSSFRRGNSKGLSLDR